MSFSLCTVLTSHGTRSKSQASTFDQDTLNQSQFTQITETFIGDAPNMDVFQHLVRYLRDGYVETEDERMGRLLKVECGSRRRMSAWAGCSR